MKVAVVGATGMVGRVMLDVLEEFNFPLEELIPVASAKSVGKVISFGGIDYKVVDLETSLALRPDVALFSAGGQTSLDWAPKFAEIGCRVIDNSSAWRMDEDTPLVVPEINPDSVKRENMIIANPNCSTIQMVLALSQLHDAFKVKRIVISTYQSITGTGVKAVEQMENERNGVSGEMIYPHPIDRNALPHCDVFLDNGYTREEMKLVHETKKIFNDPGVHVSATAVRVPVMGGHSESINVEFENEFDLNEIISLLKSTPGVEVIDEPGVNLYPTPLGAQGKNEVFVGRIRRDESQAKSLNLWVVADNLRKGAATNTVQIAQLLVEKGWLG